MMNRHIRPVLLGCARYIGYAALLGYFVVAVSEVYRNPETQVDMAAYYWGVRAYDVGMDPYSYAAVRGLSEDEETFPYVYPPAALWAFRPLSRMPLQSAQRAYLLVKLVVVVALFATWCSMAKGRVPAWLLGVVALFGFNGTLFWDIRNGNVTVFEQALFWGAMACWLRDRRWPAAMLLALCAIPKLTLIAFLPVVLVGDWRRGLRPVLAGAALFAGLTFGPFLLRPDLLNSFVGVVSTRFTSAGPWHTDFPTLLRDVSTLRLVPDAIGSSVAVSIAHCAFSALVVVVSWRHVVAAIREDRRWEFVIAACFVYALATPRLIMYSYVILILPAAAVAWSMTRCKTGAVFVAALIAASTESNSPLPYVSWAVFDIFWRYYAFFLALVLWTQSISPVAARSGKAIAGQSTVAATARASPHKIDPATSSGPGTPI